MPDVFLYQGEANPSDVKLRDPTALAGGTTYNVDLTESLTASDSISATFDAIGSLTEPVTSSESETATLTVIGVLTESGTSSESETAILTAVGLLTESVTANDSETALLTALGALTESGSASESESAIFTTNAAITESVTANESETGASVVDRTLSESLTADESETGTYSTDAASSESATASDSQVTRATFEGLVSESLDASEVAAVGEVGEVTESVTASDSATATVMQAAPAQPEAFGIAWIGSRVPVRRIQKARLPQIASVEFVESITADSSETATVVLSANVTELLAVNDSLEVAVDVVVLSSERIEAHDVAVATVTTTASVVDGIQAEENSDAVVLPGNETQLDREITPRVRGQRADSGHPQTSAPAQTPAPISRSLLETIEVEGVTLLLYDDLSISIDIPNGASIDVTVSKGEPEVVVDLPLLSDLYLALENK